MTNWQNMLPEQLKKEDTLLLGRVTYQLFASYWPTPSAYKENPIVAPMLNDIKKIVFSRTLDRAGADRNSKA